MKRVILSSTVHGLKNDLIDSGLWSNFVNSFYNTAFGGGRNWRCKSIEDPEQKGRLCFKLMCWEYIPSGVECFVYVDYNIAEAVYKSIYSKKTLDVQKFRHNVEFSHEDYQTGDKALKIDVHLAGDNTTIEYEGSNGPVPIWQARAFANRLLGYIEDMSGDPPFNI